MKHPARVGTPDEKWPQVCDLALNYAVPLVSSLAGVLDARRLRICYPAAKCALLLVVISVAKRQRVCHLAYALQRVSAIAELLDVRQPRLCRSVAKCVLLLVAAKRLALAAQALVVQAASVEILTPSNPTAQLPGFQGEPVFLPHQPP